MGVKRPDREAYHSPLPSVKVNACMYITALHLSTENFPFKFYGIHSRALNGNFDKLLTKCATLQHIILQLKL